MKYVGIFTIMITALFPLISAAQDVKTVETEDEIRISGIEDSEVDDVLQAWRDDYVRYIITDWEKEEWNNLETRRQKLEFIEYFWKMRDPDISTPENEFREEYQDRWNYVNRAFTAGKHGWRTDRGRIYLLLGPPNDIERNPMGRNRSERPSEIWYYNNVENPKLPAQITVSFVDFMGYGDYEIVSDIDRTAPLFTRRFGISMNNLDAYGLRRAGEINLENDYVVSQMFEETVVRNPEILSTELFNLQDELRYIAEVPHLKVKKLSEKVRTEIATTEFTFGLDAYSLPVSDGNSVLPVTLMIPLTKVSYVEDPAKGRTYQLNIYARLFNDSDNFVFEDKLTIPVGKDIYQDPERARQLNRYMYQFLFAAEPGTYTLSVTVRDELSKNVGFNKSEVKMHSPSKDSLYISDIVFADLVSPLRGNEAGNFSSVAPFKVADRKVVPNVGDRIDVDNELFYLYFHVNNFKLSQDTGKPDLSVQYYIYRDGALISKTPPAEIKSTYLGIASVESRFNTRALGVGKFRILAQITDAISGEVVKDSVEFSIVKDRVLD